MIPVAGMIDWLSLSIDASFLSPEVRKICYENSDKLVKVSSTGELIYEVATAEWLRSDSNFVELRFGSTLSVRGSPARVSSCNNVFGSLDIQECALSMIRFVSVYHQIFLPCNLRLWKCTRIDVTRNYDMGSLQSVLEAIELFKFVKVGRQTRSSYDTSTSWGKGSSLHAGSAYAKGPQSRKLFSASKADFTAEQLRKADRLMRLEYSIRNLMIRRFRDSGLEWHQFTPQFLIELHTDYFSKFISNVEVLDMENILDLLMAQVGQGIPTERQATAAYDCYLRCREKGFQIAKQSYPKGTFSRHLKNLSTIGIGPADLQRNNVVPFRRRQIVLDQPVSSWDEIKLEA